MIGRRRSGRTAVAVLVMALAGVGITAAAGEAAAAPNPCSLDGVAVPTTYDHVVVIFEENASFGRVVGNTNAPYFNQLAQSCALATNYNEVAGVSQPNYMAATSGVPTLAGQRSANDNVFRQLQSAGRTWRLYAVP